MAKEIYFENGRRCWATTGSPEEISMLEKRFGSKVINEFRSGGKTSVLEKHIKIVEIDSEESDSGPEEKSFKHGGKAKETAQLNHIMLVLHRMQKSKHNPVNSKDELINHTKGADYILSKESQIFLIQKGGMYIGGWDGRKNIGYILASDSYIPALRVFEKGGLTPDEKKLIRQAAFTNPDNLEKAMGYVKTKISVPKHQAAREYMDTLFKSGGSTNKEWKVVFITLGGKKGNINITLGRLSNENDVKQAVRRRADLHIKEVVSITEIKKTGGDTLENKINTSSAKNKLTRNIKILKEHLKELRSAREKGWKEYHGDPLLPQLFQTERELQDCQIWRKNLESARVSEEKKKNIVARIMENYGKGGRSRDLKFFNKEEKHERYYKKKTKSKRKGYKK